MKRFVKFLALAIVLMMIFLQVACASSVNDVTIATIVYSEKLDETEKEWLMVLMPSISNSELNIVGVEGFVLPEKYGTLVESDEQKEIESGDVIIMKFKGELYLHYDTEPKLFADSPKEVTVVKQKIKIEKTEEGFKIFIPKTYIESEGIAVGSKLKFYNAKDNLSQISPSESIIDEIDDINVIVLVAQKDMQNVINTLAFGKVIG